MCGICGAIALNEGPVDRRGVAAMAEAIVHRGPDAGGFLEAPGVVAGIRRLRVIDLATGDQPIANEDGTVEVVFNGEIYNHVELRRDLSARGHRFRTRSDTEVLVHLWEERGVEMVGALDGMFAFCIVDRARRQTFLARDALGIKPLFVRTVGGALAFASEVRALLRYPAPPPTIDPVRLIDLVALQYVPGRKTLWTEIEKLPPGHALHVVSGTVREIRWFALPQAGDGPDGTARASVADLDGAARRLGELLKASVAAQSVADVPLGVFLSGGLDSTGIAALLARGAPGQVRSYSVGFADAAAHDERAFAQAASRAIGTAHREMVVSAEEVAALLPAAIEHLAEPVLDPALLPTWLLSRFARQEVTVALSGEGADELFGGYKRHSLQERLGWLRAVPALGAAARAGRRAGLLPHRDGQALEALGTSDPVRTHLEWSQTIARSLTGTLFDEGLVASFTRDAEAAFAPYFAARPDALGARLAADLSEWLPHDLLAKVDRASMAFSLEARVPYLARDVVAFAATLPDGLKIRGGQTKLVLRRALAGIVPREILLRDKHGFDLPLDSWIRGPLRERAREALSASSLRAWPGLDARAVEALLQGHLAGEQDFGLPLFNLLSVSLFLARWGQ